jgi:dihydroxyacid dehydratase/phosphogluconate dehydratase
VKLNHDVCRAHPRTGGRIKLFEAAPATARACYLTPESSIGEPLAFVEDGDVIALDVPPRTPMLEVHSVDR